MRDPRDRSPKSFDHFKRDNRPPNDRQAGRPDDRRGNPPAPDRGTPQGQRPDDRRGPYPPRGPSQGQRPDNRQGNYPDRGAPRGARPDNRQGGYPDRGGPRGPRPDDRRGPYPDRGPQGPRNDQRGRNDQQGRPAPRGYDPRSGVSRGQEQRRPDQRQQDFRRPDYRPAQRPDQRPAQRPDPRASQHGPANPRQLPPQQPDTRPAHLQQQGRAGDPTPFELFCAYHLGIQKDGTYKPANIHTIARQFNRPQGELKQMLQNYGLDPMSVMERDFDLAMAQIDMQLAPEGISKIELAKPIFDEFLAAKRKKIDWKKIIDEDIRENAKVFGRRD